MVAEVAALMMCVKDPATVFAKPTAVVPVALTKFKVAICVDASTLSTRTVSTEFKVGVIVVALSVFKWFETNGLVS
jgi:hypothetical protein